MRAKTYDAFCPTSGSISWCMTRVELPLRSVAELLGHQSMKMTMRDAHLSPAFLSAEVCLLDPLTTPGFDSLVAMSDALIRPRTLKRDRRLAPWWNGSGTGIRPLG